MMDEFKHLERRMEKPPDEAYETLWRDAIRLLEAAGPEKGFLLLIVNTAEPGYETAFAFSSGTQKIEPDIIEDIAVMWIDGKLGDK